MFTAGGYPGNDDDGRTLQKSLDHAALKVDMLNSAVFLKTHERSNGKLGSVGFCRAGGTTNYLAVNRGADLPAGVPFYGSAPASETVGNIQAPLLIQSAEEDKRINAMWPDFESALRHPMPVMDIAR